MQAPAFEVPVKFPPYTLRAMTDKKPHKPPIQTLSTSAIAREYKRSVPNMEARLRALGLDPVAENTVGSRTFRLWNVEQVREKMAWYETLSRSEKLALHREAAASSDDPMVALTSEVREVKELLTRIAESIDKTHKKEPREPED